MQKPAKVSVFLILTVFSLCVFSYATLEQDKYPLFLLLCGGFGVIGAAASVSGFLTGKSYGILRRNRFSLGAAGLFLLALTVSALFSAYPSVAWTGWQRYDGWLTWLVYLLLFFAASVWGGMSFASLCGLSAVQLASAALVTLQFCGVNPFSLYPEGYTNYAAFAGTLGNTNFTAVFALMSALLLAGEYAVSAGKTKWIFFAGALLGSWVTAVTGVRLAQTAFLGAAVLSAVVFAKNREVLHRLSLAFFCCGAAGLFSCALFRDTDGTGMFLFAAVLLWPAVLLLLTKCRLPRSVQNRPACWAAGFAAAAGLLTLLAVFFLGGRLGGTAGELSELLRGNAELSFGSGRIRLWRRILRHLVPERLLTGGGPDTLGVRYQALLAHYHVTKEPVVDSAHSFLLSQLVNHGLFGLVSYLLLLGSVLVPAFRRITERKSVLLLPVAGYLIAALFSVEEFLLMPFFWLLLGLLQYENAVEGTTLPARPAPGQPAKKRKKKK